MFALNSAEYFISQLGAAKAGIVMVPVNIIIAEDVIEYIIQQTEPKFSLGVMLSHMYLYMISLSHALTHSRGPVS